MTVVETCVMTDSHQHTPICDDRIETESLRDESFTVTMEYSSKCQSDQSSAAHALDVSKALNHSEEIRMEESPRILAAASSSDISLPISDHEPQNNTINISHENEGESLFKTVYNRSHGNILHRSYLHQRHHQQSKPLDDENYISDHEQYHLHTDSPDELKHQTPIRSISAPPTTKIVSSWDTSMALKIPYDETAFDIHHGYTQLKYLMNEEDRWSRLYLSVTSNIFFFLGGFFYSVVAAYAIHDEKHKITINSSYQHQDLIDTDFNPWSPGKYYIMGVLGPLFFVINAAVDIYRSTRLKNPKELDENLGFENETRWDVISAAFFGIASTIDLISSFFQGDDHGWQNDTYILSTHFYLLCAVATLIGLQFDASSTGDLLFAIGCMLFLIGTLIDTGLSYVISYGVESSQEIVLYQWSLASAILWTVDAILYLMADFFFSEAPAKILTTANDLGIPCASECIENTGVNSRNYKTVMT